MGWADAALFVLAIFTWIAGAPAWVPLTFLIAGVLLFIIIVGDADSFGQAVGEIFGSLFGG